MLEVAVVIILGIYAMKLRVVRETLFAWRWFIQVQDLLISVVYVHLDALAYCVSDHGEHVSLHHVLMVVNVKM